jgi:PII-like signaling protein
MKGIFLRFYMLEKHHYRHRPVNEWLLEEASKLGIHGGTAFRAVGGFGRHGDHFFELQGDLPVQLDFVVTEEEADKLISVISKEHVRLFYLKVPAEFGVLNPDKSDPAEASQRRRLNGPPKIG